MIWLFDIGIHMGNVYICMNDNNINTFMKSNYNFCKIVQVSHKRSILINPRGSGVLIILYAF